jgi:tRNA(fMet)-specific endonuclease VapC
LSYLLDTNVCIALMSGESAEVRAARRIALLEGLQLFVPVIVRFELQYGVWKSRHVALNQKRLNDFLDPSIEILDFDRNDADRAARIRAELEAAKMPIGFYDTLIAGQALARRLTLVTANVQEFSRVKGLRWVDWAKR